MKSFLRLKSWTELGSRRSPGGVFLQLESRMEPDSRRSPDEVLLAVEVVDGARLP